jgi:hypothetical protein
LRADIIYPFFQYPAPRVCIQKMIWLKSTWYGYPERVFRIILPYCGRWNTPSNISAVLIVEHSDRRLYFLDQCINILTAPVCKVHAVAVSFKRSGIIKVSAGIKVIVNMYSVDIVVFNEFNYSVDDQLSCFR